MENKNPYDIIDFEDITSDSAKEIILTELKEYDDDELVRQRHMANYNKNSLRLNLIDFEIQRRTDERFEKDKEFIEEQNKLQQIKDHVKELLSKKQNAIVNDVIAEFLIKKWSFKTIFGARSDEIYYYDKKIYKDDGEGIAKCEIENILEKNSKNSIIAEIVGKIKRKTRIERDNLEEKDLNLINFNNGVLNIKTKELYKHNPQYKFLSYFPVDYDKNAHYNQFQKFIEVTLDEKDVPLIQEILGYCLYRSNKFKKAFIFEGRSNTGKTTLLNIFTSIIGSKNICSTSLQKICHSVNGTFELYSKAANLHDDLSFDQIKDVGNFKMATGDGYLPAEQKFKDAFLYKSYCTLIFACNQIPNVKQNDMAYYNRWGIISFNNVINLNERDVDIDKKISLEKSGILNWAIEGLIRLIENGRFCIEEDAKDVMEYMQRSSSHLAEFVQDKLIYCNDNVMTRDELYNEYENYCLENWTGDRMSKEKLGRHFLNYCHYASDARAGSSNKRVWKHVKLKNQTYTSESVRSGR